VSETPFWLSDRMALRPTEVAKTLGVSDRTLRKWMRDEGLPSFRLGSVLRIRVSDLEKWIDERIETEKSLDEIVDELINT
jgi:excisionase family DNA binding protein